MGGALRPWRCGRRTALEDASGAAPQAWSPMHPASPHIAPKAVMIGRGQRGLRRRQSFGLAANALKGNRFWRPVKALGAIAPNAGIRAVAGALLTLLAGGLGAEVQLSTQVQRVAAAIEGDRLQTRLEDADLVAPGDELRFTITFRNASPVALDPGIIIITNPIPEGAAYLSGSARGRGCRIRFSVDGGRTFLTEAELALSEETAPGAASAAAVQALEWTYRRRLAPSAQGQVWFHVRMDPMP